jgi:uncharacterized protein
VTDPLIGLIEFVHELRAAGARVETDRVAAAAKALAAVEAPGARDPYWPMRVTLCSRWQDLAVFDAVYAAWFGPVPGDEASGDGSPAEEVAGADSAASGAAVTSTEADGGAGDVEVLMTRDVRTLTPDELAEIHALIPLLAPVARPRPAMRLEPSRSGRIDMDRTVRLMLHNGGEPSRILYRQRAHRPRRLVLLIDISGSMKAYSDLLLRFAHAAVAAGPATTEVFTLATRWTRITKQLRARRPDAAMRAVAQVESDWDGGTELGPALQGFLRQWNGRDAIRRATVVICSDGVEFGDQSMLPRQVARLSRIAHTLIWVNPKQARKNYIPLNPALRHSLRYADERLPGHSYDALRALAEVIAR